MLTCGMIWFAIIMISFGTVGVIAENIRFNKHDRI